MAGDESPSKHLPLKIVNVIVYLFFLSGGLYSVLGERGYYGGKETYLTPAYFTYWIWSITDLLFLGYIIFQFFPAGTATVAEVVGWRFPIIGVLNGIFVHLYVGGSYIAAFIFALLTALTISHVYYDLKSKASPYSTSQPALNIAFVHLPFSLWHATAVVLVILSLFSAFGVNKNEKPAGVGTIVCAIIALAWLAATSIGYALHSEKGDVAGAAVIAWFLVGIFDNQKHPAAIHWIALVAFIISLLAIIKTLYYTFTSRGGEISLEGGERAPLVG